MEEATNKRNALASLTDVAIVEILCRLPAHSLFCYKCVYRSRNHLISDYNHKVLPQTLAGFFNDIDQGYRCYTIVISEHPSLSFLPFTLANVAVSDIYNGLMLCWCQGMMDHTALSSVIRQPRSSRNCRLASILLVRLNWGSIQKHPHTSM